MPPKNVRLFLFVVVLHLFSAISSAWAIPVPITNPGFEDITGEAPLNEFTFGPLNGWGLHDPDAITGGGMGGTYFIGTLTPAEPDPVGNPGVFSFFPDGAAEGQRLGIAFNFFGSGGQGEYGFEQILSSTLQPNTRYRLLVEIGNIATGTATNGDPFPLDGFPGYRVDLLTSDLGVEQTLESDDNTLAGSIPDGEWDTSVVTFVTGAEHPQLGEDLGIRLVNLNIVDPLFPNSDLEVDFDDVRLDALELIPGDLDASFVIDGSDFLRWQRGAGTVYGSIDLGNVLDNYGLQVPVALGTVIPEPNSMTCLLGVALAAIVRKRIF